MATDITISSSTPNTADSVPCWECSRPVAYEQATRTATAWGAIICPRCAVWVSALLGPIPRSDMHHHGTG